MFKLFLYMKLQLGYRCNLNAMPLQREGGIYRDWDRRTLLHEIFCYNNNKKSQYTTAPAVYFFF